MKPSESNIANTLLERTFFAILGGLTGAIYGLLVAILIAAVVTNNFSPTIVGWSAVSFAVIGIFYGNVVGEAFIALLHFLWGLINGLAENADFACERDTKNYLRTFALIGLGTGFILIISL
jgi:hypothetical protein